MIGIGTYSIENVKLKQNLGMTFLKTQSMWMNKISPEFLSSLFIIQSIVWLNWAFKIRNVKLIKTLFLNKFPYFIWLFNVGKECCFVLQNTLLKFKFWYIIFLCVLSIVGQCLLTCDICYMYKIFWIIVQTEFHLLIICWNTTVIVVGLVEGGGIESNIKTSMKVICSDTADFLRSLLGL